MMLFPTHIWGDDARQLDMHQDLFAALRQAEQSKPSVRAAALLRIARVLTITDQVEAERLLDRGLALLAGLPEDERAAITPQAACLAACVAPDRAFALHATTSDPSENKKLLMDMARHGHANAAIEYLTRWAEEGEFPYMVAGFILSDAKDDDARRDILRSGLRAWHRRDDRAWHSLDSFLHLVQCQWYLLPADEARAEIRHVVRLIRERPDERVNGSYGGARGTVTFSSQRASHLFDLLGPLKRLDPELADAVTRENPELARAAAIYPNGHHTEIDQPVEPLSAEALEQWERDWTGFMLGSRFFRMEDETPSDFRDSFAHALRTFARDTDKRRPNAAPRECWPSAEDFRRILYAAGRYEGASGARLLDRVPDPALRLFAQIEFAAGIAGLEPIGGMTREVARWS
jgi:hypothetical protein